MYAYLLSKDQVVAKDSRKVVEYAARRYGFRLETVDLTNPEREVLDIKRILDLAVPAEWADMIPPSLEDVRAVAKGYTHAEGSTIGEPNLEMRRDIEIIGGQRYKTYSIYQKTIGT